VRGEIMRPYPLDEIRRNVHGIRLSAGGNVTISGVTIDSRTARPGDLFFALRGERFDGHDFLADAARGGCIAAIVARDANVSTDMHKLFGAGLIGVRDTRVAFGELAAFCRRSLPADVIAVTGSNGKTTVKLMIHHILSRRLSGSASPKSFNNDVGVPLTLLAVGAGEDYVVCEVGSNAPGEIATLSGICRPDVAVITSIAETHLERLGSLEGVAVEKAAILTALQQRGLAIVWADSELLDKAVRPYESRVISFGVSPQADLRLTGYKPKKTGQRFELNGRLWVDLPLLGRHNALNALAAIAVAQRFGFTQEDAAAALADFAGAAMRLERLKFGKVTVINDAYNANPASVTAAAGVLAETPARRRVMIVGDMRELGERREQLHRDTGRRIAAGKLDLLIGVGPLGRYIAEGAVETGLKVATFETVKDACAEVAGCLRSGDLVLIKGSRAMEMERLIEPIRRKFAKIRR